jgi:preprotein translocase subunit SecE
MSKIVETWKLTVDELVNKVTWPTWEELRSSTLIVIVASLVFAVAIVLMDSAFNFLTDLLYSFLK